VLLAVLAVLVGLVLPEVLVEVLLVALESPPD
jgi:hypothetical protein